MPEDQKRLQEQQFLNIPCYVDTFEAEDSKDINMIAAEIKELDAKIVGVEVFITEFCKELNISTPFK